MMITVPYCELWLEMRSIERAFRVALLVPKDMEIPEDFFRSDIQNELPEKVLFFSEWFPGIAAAKDAMNGAASFYNERSVQFLFFREIRPMTQSE
jgi:hypothetical protein